MIDPKTGKADFKYNKIIKIADIYLTEYERKLLI